MVDHVIVIGLGAVGISVVRRLVAEGESVVVIERDADNRYLAQARALGVPVVIADATQSQTHRMVNIADAKAVAVLTSADLTNIETGLSVRESLGERWDDVPVVLRVFDRELAQMMERSFGFQHVRSTSALAAPWFVGAALGLDVLSTFYVDQQPFLVAGLTVAPNGGLQGLAMQDLSRKPGSSPSAAPPTACWSTRPVEARCSPPATPPSCSAPTRSSSGSCNAIRHRSEDSASWCAVTMVEQETPGSSAPARSPADRPAPTAHGRSAFGPYVLVALSMAWGLWELRPELRAVPYLDDSSLHEQMVRAAAARISQGHLPLTSWFPYLGLGSPQFLHYQSLPSMVSGLVGTVVDPDTVFRWSLYLLLALWPITVYWSGRLFGLSRWTAASAAAVAPFLASAAGIGYETKAYVWVGYGVWTQLWASWTLPLAWGFTYRALSSLRGAFWAVLFIMLTVALHYETGYLAFVPLVVWPFIAPSDLWRRIGRAVALGAAAVLASAWVIVPLLQQSHWAARNQVLEGTGLENGYGARQMLIVAASPATSTTTATRRPGCPSSRSSWPSASASAWPAGARSWPAAPSCHLGRHARHVVRADDLRVALRHRAGQQRHLHPALRNGPAAVGHPAGRRRPRLPRPARPGGRLGLFPEDRRGWVAQPAGRGIVAGVCIVALVAGARARLEQHGHLRRPQRDQHRPPGGGRRAPGPPDRPVVGLRARPSQGARLRRVRRPTGARTSWWGTSRCSSTWRARTSTRWATRCGRRRS